MKDLSTEINPPENAQGRLAHLLPALDIITDVTAEFSVLQDDAESLRLFLMQEFAAFGISTLRCGCLIHLVEQQKIYERFGCKNATTFFTQTLGIDKTYVSRLRTAWPYCHAISEALPEARLTESQIRELRAVVGEKEMKEEDKVREAVKVYKKLHKKHGGNVTASSIKALAPAKPATDKPATDNPIKIPSQIETDVVFVLRQVLNSPQLKTALRATAEGILKTLGLLDAPHPASTETPAENQDISRSEDSAEGSSEEVPQENDGDLGQLLIHDLDTTDA